MYWENIWPAEHQNNDDKVPAKIWACLVDSQKKGIRAGNIIQSEHNPVRDY